MTTSIVSQSTTLVPGHSRTTNSTRGLRQLYTTLDDLIERNNGTSRLKSIVDKIELRGNTAFVRFRDNSRITSNVLKDDIGKPSEKDLADYIESQITKPGVTKVVLVLDNVCFINASGLKSLAFLQRKLQKTSKKLILCGAEKVPGFTSGSLKTTGLSQYFTFASSMEEAKST